MDTTILSIDPGAKGFLSVLHIGNEITPIECVPIPTWKVKVNKKDRVKVNEEKLSKLIHLLIDKYNITEIVIEEQRVQAGQGLTSTGSTMQHFGWLKGYCYGKQVNKTIVSPKEWQTIYPDYIGKDKDFEPKDKSKLYCSILFPDLDLRRTTRCKDFSDGKTDSLLIGVWKAIQLKEVK